MDDRRFQRELQHVKQRVLTMRDRHQLSPRLHPSAASPMQSQTISDVHDIFTAQMSTIQTQLAALEANVLSGLNTSGPLDFEGQDAATAGSRVTHIRNPPEPSAKLCTVATSQDVHGLNERVADLEHMLSGLQDDLESLNQAQYTPSCSVDSFADRLSGTRRDECATTESPFYGMATKDSMQHNVDVSLQLREMQDSAEQVSSLPFSPVALRSINRHTKSFPVPDLPTEERADGKQINESREAMNLSQVLNQASTSYRHPVGNVACHDHHMILDCAANISAVRDDLSSTRHLLYQHNQSFQQKHHKDISDLYKRVAEMQSMFNLHIEQQSQSCMYNGSLSGVEGFKPYEKERTRLNELSCNAEDKFKGKELCAFDKDEAPIVATSKHEPCVVRPNNLLPTTVQTHRAYNFPQNELAATAANTTGTHSTLDAPHGFIEAWSRSYRNLEQEIRDCRSDRDDAIQQVQRLTTMLQDAEDREREYTKSHTHEIDHLHEFCKKKDDIVSQQELKIARSAALLEQRDDQIEDLTRRLREAENDRDEGRDQFRTVTDLLEDTNETLAATKRQTIEICARPKTLTGFGTVVADLQHRLEDIGRLMADSKSSGEPSSGRDGSAIVNARELGGPDTMSTTSHGARGPKPDKVPKMWSPQPLVGRRNLAGEACRASIWASNYSPPVFGQPGIIGFSGVEKRRSACAETTNSKGQCEGGTCGVRGPANACTSSECVHPQRKPKREHQPNAGQAGDRESKPLGSHDDEEEVTAQGRDTNADGSTKPPVRLHALPGQLHYRGVSAASSSAPAPSSSRLVRPWVSQTAMRLKRIDGDHLRPLPQERSAPRAATVESDPDSKGGE